MTLTLIHTGDGFTTFPSLGYGGGGGGGGVFEYMATTVNYDDSMTINVDGGARGEGDTSSDRRGLAGSAGKVFMNGVEV